MGSTFRASGSLSVYALRSRGTKPYTILELFCSVTVPAPANESVRASEGKERQSSARDRAGSALTRLTPVRDAALVCECGRTGQSTQRSRCKNCLVPGTHSLLLALAMQLLEQQLHRIA